MSKENNIDQKIKAVLSNRSIQPSRDRWSEIESILDKDIKPVKLKQKPLYLFMALAAAVSTILLSVVYFKSFEQIKSFEGTTPAVAKANTDPQNSNLSQDSNLSPLTEVQTIEQNVARETQPIKGTDNKNTLNTSTSNDQKPNLDLVNQGNDFKNNSNIKIEPIISSLPNEESKEEKAMDFDSLYNKMYIPFKLRPVKFKSRYSFDSKQIIAESTPRKAIWRKALDIAEDNATNLIVTINDRNFESEK